jgi:hypothetical protein
MKRNKHKLVPTWLPVFSGFYENIYWEENMDMEAEYFRDERGYKGDGSYKQELWRFFDYQKWHKDIAERFTHLLAKQLSGFVKEIKFEEVRSPKEYNFYNDAINVLITPRVNKIRDFVYANKEAFDKYLHDRYTSYDGFMSFYANNFDAWEMYTSSFKDLTDDHYLGSILQFICTQLEITESSLYEDVREGMCESEYFEQELYDKIEEVENYAKEIYLEEDRLSLMYSRFDPEEFDLDLILHKTINEVEKHVMVIPFED